MTVAARVNPREHFTAEEWAPLAARSSWRGLALVAHCWGVILAAAAMAMAFPLTLPLAVVIIGGRQLGLGILLHEAAHGALHRDPKVNDWVGQNLTGGGLLGYRAYHLKHHRYAQQAEDPDLPLSAPFPTTPLSMRRKLLRDLTGQTYWKQRWAPAFKALTSKDSRGRRGAILMRLLRGRARFFIGAAVTIAVTAPFGFWWAWFALWLLPQATWLPAISRLRNIAEHALVAKDEPDPYRHARTTHASWIERAILAPYWVNYHGEHHLFMYAPCYNLPRIHQRLRAGPEASRLLNARGYIDVLKLAAGRPAKEDAGASPTPEARGVFNSRAL